MKRTIALSQSSLALSNLRAVVILVVLAFHSVLAYVQWMPVQSRPFDAPPYGWRAFPIIDDHRWLGFDLFCAWQDVYLMSLMFLLSGLFVWPSLQRKSNWGFVRDRLRRLGVPFVFGVTVIIPIAIYPSYLASGGEPSLAEYGRQYLDLPFWPNGQLWFLWQLLALNAVAVGVNWVAPNALCALGRWSAAAGKRPLTYFLVLLAVSTIAYVPLALAFTPWEWSNSGLLAVQWSRPLLYGVYFFAGVGIGAGGIEVGLTAAEGALGRHWRLWLAAAIVTLFLWMGVTSLTLDGPAPFIIDVAADLCFVVACAAGCFFVIASSLRFGTRRSAALDAFSTNAYSLYLLHYDFVVWLQYALLGTALFALIKGLIVFCATVTLTWAAVVAIEHLPFGARLLGSKIDAAAKRNTAPPASAGETGLIAEPSGPPR